MSKTEENLKTAFSGESQARNKYEFFAKVAFKEGYNYVGKIFLETAANEMQHAKEEFKKLRKSRRVLSKPNSSAVSKSEPCPKISPLLFNKTSNIFLPRTSRKSSIFSVSPFSAPAIFTSSLFNKIIIF